MIHSVHIFRRGSFENFRRDILPLLPRGPFRKIFIKPNWVMHESTGEFPIRALITSPLLIEEVVEAVFMKYPGCERVWVGDVPLQSCDFERMLDQSGTRGVMERCAAKFGDKVRFMDLRRERFRLEDGFMKPDLGATGDPLGYAEVALGAQSLLEPVSRWSHNFRVSDYDPVETKSAHGPGRHNYLIARSILDSDLVINLPKMKTHQKSGVTGALKNLVGINGSKAFLVHHRLGTPSRGGDEFPDGVSPAIYWQVRVRELLQKRFRPLFRAARLVWLLIKKLQGIETAGTRENLQKGGVYIGAGSWHGNDSIWRMVYDLNYMLLFAPPEGGGPCAAPRRQVLSIMDGIVAGEGNGPLQPLPIEAGVLIASQNPFLVDFAMAKMMGFDWQKIPLLANHPQFQFPEVAKFSPDSFQVVMDGTKSPGGVRDIPILKTFLPPPGWRGHIELLDGAETGF